MNPTALAQIARWLDAAPPDTAAEVAVRRVCTDTRALAPGDLFVALRGEHFDGHQFVAAAAQRGACAAVVAAACTAPAGFPLLRVPDTLTALQTLAARYRQTLPTRVLGVTGSNGKTSVKDFAAAVLARRFRTLKTDGNLNNHIGVPLMLLRLESAHETAVLEMGMNHAGEIAPLAQMTAPVAGIVTNIGVAHIEFLGSREAIAREKADLVRAVPESGLVILDAEDEFTPFLAGCAKAPVTTIGLNKGDLRARGIVCDDRGMRFLVADGAETFAARLPVPGVHMVRNALFALAAGRHFGVPLGEGIAALADVVLTGGRLQRRVVRGVHFLDDSYNANPDSMIAALDTLGALPCAGRRIAVLGKMNELGAESDRGHRAAGEAAARAGTAVVICVTPGAAPIAAGATLHGVPQVFQTQTTQEAGRLLRELARADDLVLVKGSHSVHMEQVIEEFAR